MSAHRYTVSYFESNSLLVDEWNAARGSSQLEPMNLRPEMTTLQRTPWRTSAITSQASLLTWIKNRANGETNPPISTVS